MGLIVIKVAGVTHFTASIVFLEGLTLVVSFFATGEGDFKLGKTILGDEKTHGDNGVTCLLGSALELAQLTLGEEEFAVALHVMVIESAKAVGGNLHILNPQLIADKEAISVGEGGFALADRFDFRAIKHYSSRQTVGKYIIKGGSFVLNLSSHNRSAKLQNIFGISLGRMRFFLYLCSVLGKSSSHYGSVGRATHS